VLIASGQDFGPTPPISGAEAQRTQESRGTTAADSGTAGSGFSRELDRALGGEATRSLEYEQKPRGADADDRLVDPVKGSQERTLKESTKDQPSEVKARKEQRGNLRKVARDAVPERAAMRGKRIRSDSGLKHSELRLPEHKDNDLDLGFEGTFGVGQADRSSSTVTAAGTEGLDHGRVDESAAPAVAAMSGGETAPAVAGKKVAQRERNGIDAKSVKRGDLPASDVRTAHRQSGEQTEFSPLNIDGDDSREGAEFRDQKQERSDRPTIEIRDYRTAKAASPSEVASPVENAVELETRPNDSSQDGGIRLVRLGAEQVATQRPSVTDAGRSESPFSAYVREHLGSEVVKQTGIILKNGDRGEIRLVLKPEHLGRVRMRIHLDQNRLSGRIFVDSSFVKESFEQSLEELYRAFRSNGYETGSFEVLVDGRNEGRGAGEKRKDGLSAKTLKQLDEAVPILEEIDYQSELINLVI
jgi:hypothetical protein